MSDDTRRCRRCGSDMNVRKLDEWEVLGGVKVYQCKDHPECTTRQQQITLFDHRKRRVDEEKRAR